MEYFLIFTGILAIGCTFVLFMTISVHSKKITDIHKALKNMHLKVLNVESDVNLVKKQRNTNSFRKNRNYQKDYKTKREVIYKVPKRISGDLTMEHEDKLASVKAVLKVKEVD